MFVLCWTKQDLAKKVTGQFAEHDELSDQPFVQATSSSKLLHFPFEYLEGKVGEREKEGGGGDGFMIFGEYHKALLLCKEASVHKKPELC